MRPQLAPQKTVAPKLAAPQLAVPKRALISNRAMLIAFMVAVLAITGWAVHAAANDPHAAGDGGLVDLQHRLSKLEVQTLADGSHRVILQGEDGPVPVTPDRFIELLAAQRAEQAAAGWLYIVLNITSPIGVAWVLIGVVGQIMFTGRMVIQWLVSEKAGRSMVPTIFWWLSLLGASMLIVYFIWRKDIVGIAGQSTGWIIYARNLWLIYVPKEVVPTPVPLDDDTDDADEKA